MKDEKQLAYERREVKMYDRHVKSAIDVPLSYRQEARDEYSKMMADDWVSLNREIGYVFGGHMGPYPRELAMRIRGYSKRTNRVAALSALVAMMSFKCPENFARQAWKELTTRQQQDVDALYEEWLSNKSEEDHESWLLSKDWK